MFCLCKISENLDENLGLQGNWYSEIFQCNILIIDYSLACCSWLLDGDQMCPLTQSKLVPMTG